MIDDDLDETAVEYDEESWHREWDAVDAESGTR